MCKLCDEKAKTLMGNLCFFTTVEFVSDILHKNNWCETYVSKDIKKQLLNVNTDACVPIFFISFRLKRCKGF